MTNIKNTALTFMLSAFSMGMCFNAHALDYQSITISRDASALDPANSKTMNSAWEIHNRTSYNGTFALLPMTEELADALGALDQTKIYKCDARIYDADRAGVHSLAVPLYEIKNCQEVAPPKGWPLK